LRDKRYHYPTPVVGDWVKMHTTHKKGSVHRITPDGKFIILVPQEDWPFPAWVSTWPENLRRIRRPETPKVEYDLEPAPF